MCMRACVCMRSCVRLYTDLCRCVCVLAMVMSIIINKKFLKVPSRSHLFGDQTLDK